MHVLARFAPHVHRCGVWSDDSAELTAIEACPSACKTSALVTGLWQKYTALGHGDDEDALTCGLIAWLFAHEPQLREAPPDEGVPADEVWIWMPGMPWLRLRIGKAGFTMAVRWLYIKFCL